MQVTECLAEMKNSDSDTSPVTKVVQLETLLQKRFQHRRSRSKFKNYWENWQKTFAV